MNPWMFVVVVEVVVVLIWRIKLGRRRYRAQIAWDAWYADAQAARKEAMRQLESLALMKPEDWK